MKRDEQLKNNEGAPSLSALRRAKAGGAILTLILLALISRVVHIQYDNPEQYTRLAAVHRNNPRQQTLRGNIYDRRGRLLAANVPKWSVFADPSHIDTPLETARILARVLDGDVQQIYNRLKRDDRRFAWVKRQVSESRAEWVRALELKGVYMRRENERFYPFGSLLSHVVGFTDIDGNGLEGAEARFDKYLSGKANAGNNSEQIKPFRGNDLYLSIDSFIQTITHKALMKQVERHKPEAAWAVVLNARTAEVLAMVNWPTFDPGTPARNSAQTRRNNILSDTYEYGSVIKPITAAIALENETVEPDTEIDCHLGVWRFGRRRIRDVRDHGILTVSDIVTYSSNIGSAQMGLKLGTERFWWGLRNFGFGERTGVELPGESIGIFRDKSAWNDHSLISIAFGQEISVNGLAMARAYTPFANNGLLLNPTIVNRIYDPVSDTNLYHFDGPKHIRRAVSERTAKEVLKMMHRVVEEGTGSRAAVDNYSVGGKTGTGTLMDPDGGGYSRDRYISTFVGLAPVEEPEIIALVSLKVPTEGGYYGGTVAGPAFSEIIGNTLGYLNIPPKNTTKFIAEGGENVYYESLQ